MLFSELKNNAENPKTDPVIRFYFCPFRFHGDVYSDVSVPLEWKSQTAGPVFATKAPVEIIMESHFAIRRYYSCVNILKGYRFGVFGSGYDKETL